MAERLLPDRLKDLWQDVEHRLLTHEQFLQEQGRGLAEYRRLWDEALICRGCTDLRQSLHEELARYSGCRDLGEIERRCASALADVKGEWCGGVNRADDQSVAKFYNESEAMIYELMGWHSLADDDSPLAYVVALLFARGHGCRTYLDFGAGVGSGAILFARHGLEVTLADISSPMLDFSQWRFCQRRLTSRFIDLKSTSLPANAFDLVAAMDVFEHLVDPAKTVTDLWQCLKPGGFLFGRFHSEVDEDRPHHIVQDFQPTLDRLRELGFEEVWRDEWLWGHQVFRKSQ